MQYILKVISEDKYISLNENGKYDLTEDIFLATQFKNQTTANNFMLNSLPKNLLYADLEAIKIDDDIQPITNNSFNTAAIKLRDKFEKYTAYKDISASSVSYLNAVIKLLNEENKLNEYLSKYDSHLVDISHYIEFKQISENDSMKIIELQKRILQKRRICKDRLEIIKKLKRMGLEYFKSLSTFINRMENRKYSPRSKV